VIPAELLLVAARLGTCAIALCLWAAWCEACC
jgi:hypothetical protein